MDTVVAGFAFSLPARHKVRGFSKKRLLRKALEPLLPAEVVNGRKRGFSIPAAAWLRGELEPFARETLLRRDAAAPGLHRPRSCVATARRPRGRSGRSVAPAVGTARVHALARATRRGNPPRRDARGDGGRLDETRPGGRCRPGERLASARMRVWIDMTASAHPLVFRPLVELLQARGDEVEITARQYAQTLQLIESHGMTATPIGHHGGRSRLGKVRQMESRLRSAPQLGARTRLRRRARSRVARADDHRAPARNPERDDLRLRVGVESAPARLPGRHASRRPGLDPDRPPCPLRRRAAEAAPVPGAEGGVLPRRLRRRSGRARAVGDRP